MARRGLGAKWRCLFANDFCDKKAASYRLNYGPSPELLVGDVAKVSLSDLNEKPTLVWASFPCQDLSLAGNGQGLKGERSGTFWPFWKLMLGLKSEGREPPIIVLENVVGAVTSNNGKDFSALIGALTKAGYRVGPLVMDAVHFVPQSRPRLFIVAVHESIKIPRTMLEWVPNETWHPRQLRKAYDGLPPGLKAQWLWLRVPMPPARSFSLADVIEEEPTSVRWHTAEETSRILHLMSSANLAKVEKAKSLKARTVGTVYKRTRLENGEKVQRAEVRFDQVSGCLRTPVGGSSRQLILVVDGKDVRSRLLSPREAARLMGVDDSYRLPANYNEGYHLMGDAVAVPVVSWLERHILAPLAIGLEKTEPKHPRNKSTDERPRQRIAANQ